MAWVNIVELIYPVGAVYTSADSTSPADLFGGTWEDISDVWEDVQATTENDEVLYAWKRTA